MKKAVYIYKSTGWKNANDNLDIRGNYGGHNTIQGTPTVPTVPRVFTWTGSKFEQIYPALDQSHTVTFENLPLDHYRYRSGQTKNIGWVQQGKASQGYFGQDWDDDGVNDYMGLVNRTNIGWIGLGPNLKTESKFPAYSKVKEIKYLKFNITRAEGAGHWGSERPIFFGLNNITGTVVNGNKTANNPHLNIKGGPVEVGNLKPCGNTTTSKTELVIDLSSTKGKEVANLIMRWMKGEANSICLYSGETTGISYKGVGCWSKNYLKISSFSMTMQYVSEG